MSHQQYIDYLNSVASVNSQNISNNNLSINIYTSAISGLNTQIGIYQSMIVDLQNSNTQLTADNNTIADIIALL